MELFGDVINPLGLANPVARVQLEIMGLVKVVYILRQEETRAVTEHLVEERVIDGVCKDGVVWPPMLIFMIKADVHELGFLLA